MGGIDTLVVLDLAFAAERRQALEADRTWIVSDDLPASLTLSGGAVTPDWHTVGGVVEVASNHEYKEYQKRRPVDWDPLNKVYFWEQTVRGAYWLIIVLPSGKTLGTVSPKPNGAGDLGDRFSVWWQALPAQQVEIKNAWDLVDFADGDRSREVDRLRSLLPLAEMKRASALQRIAYMKRGAGILLLVIALIAAWISLPSGLAIPPPHVPLAGRIPATVIFIAAAFMSFMGLWKGSGSRQGCLAC